MPTEPRLEMRKTHEILIFIADGAEGKSAVIEADAAAGTVVADFGNLVLKLMLR